LKKIIEKILILGFIVTALLGILFHFMYDICDKNIILGAIFPVNESIWEHLKLIYFPMIISTVIEYPLLKKYSQNFSTEKFLSSKTTSIFAGVILTVILFYTYNGIIGKNYAAVDILIYFIAIAAAYIIFYSLNYSKKFIVGKKSFVLFITLLIVLGLLMIIFTYFPPHIPLFKDMRSGSYGI
jgi:hypothetical protein